MTNNINKQGVHISVVIATIGRASLFKTLQSISQSSIIPSEILIVIPEKNLNKIHFINNFDNLNLKKIITKESNQVVQRINGFNSCKSPYVLQLDDDVIIEENTIEKLLNFSLENDNTAVAPRYKNNLKISKIYRKPDNLLLKFYHWIINGSRGYSPGSISLSGFNYSDENSDENFKEQEWLSGGAILHQKKNLILNNYFMFNYSKCYCEDILHSLKLRENKVRLFKLYTASISTESGSIISNSNIFETLKNLCFEMNVRFYIVKNYKKSYIRFALYYFIFFLRIILKFIKGK